MKMRGHRWACLALACLLVCSTVALQTGWGLVGAYADEWSSGGAAVQAQIDRQESGSTESMDGSAGSSVDSDAAATGGGASDGTADSGKGSQAGSAPLSDTVDEQRPLSEAPAGGDAQSGGADPVQDMDSFAREHKGTLQEGVYAFGAGCAPRRVLDVASGSKASGANVQIYESNMTNAQRWRVRKVGSYLVIENVASGKVLDVAAGAAFAGTNVRQYDYNGSDAQKWVAVANQDGTLTLYSALGHDLVLDISGKGDYNGANVQVYTCNGSAAQRFSAYASGRDVPSAGRTVADGVYTISESASGLALDARNGGTSDGTALQLFSANGTASQAFYVSYDESAGYYTIVGVGSGRYLDADQGDLVPGCDVNLWGAESGSRQSRQRYWSIEGSGDGPFTIRNAANGYVLSAKSVSASGRVVVDASSTRWSMVADAAHPWSAADVDALASSHAGELEPGTYLVSSALRSHSVLDVSAGSTADYANVQLYQSNNTKAQRWKVEDAGGGYVSIKNVKSGRVLDVSGGSRSAGANVQQYGWNKSRAQKWVPVRQQDGSYVFFSALGRSLVLDVSGGSAADGANVQVYTCNGSAAQRFSLISTTVNVGGQDQTIDDGIYNITFSTDSNSCADVTNASSDNGAKVQAFSSNGTLAQAFRITYDKKSGSYSIRAAHTGKALDLCDGDLIPGANVQQWDFSSTNINQRWLIEPQADGSYYIRSVANGLYLDHGKGSGKLLSTERGDGSVDQSWRFSAAKVAIAEGCYTVSSSAASNRVLDVVNGSTDNGAGVQGYASNGTFAQKWWVSANGDGTYAIQNVGSAKYLATNVSNGVIQVSDKNSSAARWQPGICFGKGYLLINSSTGYALNYNGGSLNTVPANGGSASQGWKFSSSSIVSDGFYEFAPAHASGMRLDIYSGSKDDGANAQIYQSNGSLSQRYWIRSTGDGWYTITACNSAKDLDVKDYGTAAGTNVQQWSRGTGNQAQRWKFSMGPYGIKVISACGGNVLDVWGAGTGNYTNVDVYTDNGSAAQGWRLIPASRPAKIGYQNPPQYPQVSSLTVVLPSYCTGEFTYVTPSRIAIDATRTDCVNAFIQRAFEYLGTQYIEPYSTAPGGAVDCSGFVLQCLYATGMDMGVYNPYNHRWLPWQTYNSMNWYNNNTFMPVNLGSIQRGDVIYYRGHIAIYLGNGQIIDSWPGLGVTIRGLYSPGNPIGAARPFV